MFLYETFYPLLRFNGDIFTINNSNFNSMYFKSIFLLLCLIASTASFAQRNKDKKPKVKKEKFHYLSHCKTAEEIRKTDNKLEKLYYSFLGEFNNSSQAASTENPTLKTPQSLIAVPIWRERTGEYWFYMGWFIQGKPEKALSQAVYKLTKENRDTFKLVSYFIPNETENNFYAYEWQKEKPFSNLSPKQVIASQNDIICPHYIVPRNEQEFDLLLDQEFCQRNISEAIQSFKHCATLSPEVNRTYTEFFDKNQKLIFSYPRPDGFELVRVDKNQRSFQMVQKKPAKN